MPAPDERSVRLEPLPVLQAVELVQELDGADHLDLPQQETRQHTTDVYVMHQSFDIDRIITRKRTILISRSKWLIILISR